MAYKNEYKEEIENLLETLFKCAKTIKTEQRETSTSFDKWIEKNGFDIRGIRETSRHNLKTQLRNLLKEDNTNDGIGILELEDLKKYQDKIKRILALTKEWVSAIKPATFEGKKFYAYFFYSQDEDIEPKFGRAILETTADRVEFKNVPDDLSKDYFGHYSYIHNDVFFFDLNTKTGDSSLHIKVYCSDTEKNTILLGSYITFEDHHIVRGSLVLEAIDKNISKPTSAKISFKENQDLLESINPAIRQYLSQKKHNYSKTKRRVFNIEHLQNFKKKKYQEKWESRFIEVNKPILYIASPLLSTSTEIYNKYRPSIKTLTNSIHKTFDDKIEIHSLEEKEDLSNKEMTVTPPSLQTLTHTRFFILIYSNTQKGSYSLVQLGWAIAHCKMVIVIYEAGSISDHIIRIKNIGVKLYPFKNLKKEIKNIYKNVENDIKNNLNSY